MVLWCWLCHFLFFWYTNNLKIWYSILFQQIPKFNHLDNYILVSTNSLSMTCLISSLLSIFFLILSGGTKCNKIMHITRKGYILLILNFSDCIKNVSAWLFIYGHPFCLAKICSFKVDLKILLKFIDIIGYSVKWKGFGHHR